MPNASRNSRFDERYFRKWYHDPRHCVRTSAELRRQVHVALSAAEWVLTRPVRSVLDVGCGEGAWERALRVVRPRIRYDGVDPSSYVVARSRGRRVRQGTFASLELLDLPGPYDLVVCTGVAQYLTPADLARGLETLRSLTLGVLHLEIFTSRDAVQGDTRRRLARSASWYRAQLRRAGFVAIGLHNYAAPASRARLTDLEQLA